MSIDKDSPTWRAVKAAVAVSLAAECALLETALGPEPTMLARGKIAAYRAVLALADTPPTITDSGELY